MVLRNSSNKSAKALASGLAGAAAIASGSQAYGSIQLVGNPADVPNAAAPNSAVGPVYDMNSDATADFQFQFRNPQSATQVYWQANVFGNTGAGVVGYTGPFGDYASKLTTGTPISGASVFKGPTQVILGSRYGGPNGLLYGGFGTMPGPGCLGLKFLDATGGVHFGWIRLELKEPVGATAGPPGGIYFSGAAYESQVNTAIPACVTPEPGSLAMLAIGAAGVLAARRRTS